MQGNPQRAELVDEARRSVRAARIAVRHLLAEHGATVSLLQEPRRALRVARFRTLARLRDRASGDPYLDTTRVFPVSTASLRHRTLLPYGYDPALRPGAVVGGDWDLVNGTIEGSAYWIEYREALQGRRAWRETHAFESLMRRAESEHREWRRRIFRRDVECLIRGYEELYASMCANGCLTQRQLSRERGCAYRPVNTDDISVAVGRTGELLLCQGGHRVEAARALGIPQVPVWIGVRHTQWWEFRRSVVAQALHRGRVPDRLPHPDLETLPHAFDPAAVSPLVRQALAGERGLVVDLSPGWGSLLHLLEDDGFSCAAVSGDADERRFLERLREAGEKRFVVAAASDELPAGPRRVSALLLVREAETRLAAREAREALRAALARLRPRHVLLGGVGTGGRGGLAHGSRPADSPSPAVRLVAAVTGLDRLETPAGAEGERIVHLSAAAGD